MLKKRFNLYDYLHGDKSIEADFNEYYNVDVPVSLELVSIVPTRNNGYHICFILSVIGSGMPTTKDVVKIHIDPHLSDKSVQEVVELFKHSNTIKQAISNGDMTEEEVFDVLKDWLQDKIKELATKNHQNVIFQPRVELRGGFDFSDVKFILRREKESATSKETTKVLKIGNHVVWRKVFAP